LDYYNADNEGHMMAKIRIENLEKDNVRINAGDRYMQGIFVQYFVTDDDNTTAERTGGFGSTGK
jgi:dUTP pyrophosphatase